MPVLFVTDGAWGTGVHRTLSDPEIDGNFWSCIQRIAALEAIAASGAQIVSFEWNADGSLIYVHMSDYTTLGPFAFPVLNPRGYWLPTTHYNDLDLFIAPDGGAYVTIFPHTSALTFDPAANDGMGHDFYEIFLPAPVSALPAGGNTDDVLGKVNGTDYVASWRPSGLPRGGSTGQILKKTSGADWTAAWGGLTVDELSDVGIYGLADGDVFKYDAGLPGWTNVPGAITFADVGGVASPLQVRQPTITALGSSGTVDLDPTLGDIFTITPTGTVTIQATTVPAGARISVVVITSGTTPYDVSFGGGFVDALGSMNTGIIDSRMTTITFVSDGTHFYEESRTGNIKVNVNAFAGGTTTIDPFTTNIFSVTPLNDTTLRAFNIPIGKLITIEIVSSGTTSYNVAFSSTGFKAIGSVSTGKVSGVTTTVTFIGDGTNLVEIARSTTVAASPLSGTTGTISIDPTLSQTFTVVPTGSITLNAASAPVGQMITLVVTTSGTSSWNITPNTNFKTQGALSTGTVSGKVFTMTFIGDGTNMNEVGRTTAM